MIAEEGDDLSNAVLFASENAGALSSEPATEEKVPEPPKSEAPKPASTGSESKADLLAGDRIFASPVAKKIALEHGVPLSKVKGSGPEGRILREDVEKYKASEGGSAGIPSSVISPSPSTQLPDYTDIPISNMRRTIGARLTQSKQELPHYYVTLDIAMDKVMKLREVFNKALAEKDKAAKLSMNDFIVKAVACALKDVPEANSAWLGETIRQ